MATRVHFLGGPKDGQVASCSDNWSEIHWANYWCAKEEKFVAYEHVTYNHPLGTYYLCFYNDDE